MKQSMCSNGSHNQSMESFITPRENSMMGTGLTVGYARQSDKVLHDQIQQKARESQILKQRKTPSKSGTTPGKSPSYNRRNSNIQSGSKLASGAKSSLMNRTPEGGYQENEVEPVQYNPSYL
jgi:hypothetical protein